MYSHKRTANKKMIITVSGSGRKLPFIASIPLPLEDEFYIKMPHGSTILTPFVKVGELSPRLYLMLEDSASTQIYRVRVIGTGNLLPKGMSEFNFIGTVNNRPYVWHVFAEKYETTMENNSIGPDTDPDTDYGLG